MCGCMLWAAWSAQDITVTTGAEQVKTKQRDKSDSTADLMLQLPYNRKKFSGLFSAHGHTESQHLDKN